MMKLATIFKSRGSISGQLLVGAQDVIMGSARFSTFAQRAPTVAQKASTGGRLFAPLKLYKGKAAFNADLIAPTFTKNEAGDLFLKRSGCIMLTFSPSIGLRKYDWERKQLFAMSPTEVGSLVCLGPGGSCEFFHDPAIQTSNAGQMRKSLQVKGNPDGNYMITLNVVDKVKKVNEYFAIQATPGEFSVIRTSFSFALPHILGWDRNSNMPPPMKAAEYSSNSGPKASFYPEPMKAAEYSSKSGPKASFDPEWDR